MSGNESFNQEVKKFKQKKKFKKNEILFKVSEKKFIKNENLNNQLRQNHEKLVLLILHILWMKWKFYKSKIKNQNFLKFHFYFYPFF